MSFSLAIGYILNLGLLLMQAFGNKEEWKKRDRSTYPLIKLEKTQNLFPSELFSGVTSDFPVMISDYYIKQLSSSSKMVLLY